HRGNFDWIHFIRQPGIRVYFFGDHDGAVARECIDKIWSIAEGRDRGPGIFGKFYQLRISPHLARETQTVQIAMPQPKDAVNHLDCGNSDDQTVEGEPPP